MSAKETLRERLAEIHTDPTQKPPSGTMEELMKLNKEQDVPLTQEEFKTLWKELRSIPPEHGRDYLRHFGERCRAEDGMSRQELFKRLWSSNQMNLREPLERDAIGRLVSEVWVTEDTILKGDNLLDSYDTCYENAGYIVDELLYPEAVHTIFSPGGTGKTIFALWTASVVMKNGGKVIYIDAENGKKHILRLCRSYGWSKDFMRDSFIYMYQPDINKSNCEIWEDTLYYHKPDLVIFDSLADFLSVDGFKENDAVDVTEWMRLYAQPVKDAGGAALILDHVAKDENAKGPRGSTAKRNAVDVAWKLKVTKAFNKDSTGAIQLYPDKDRFGELPNQKSFRIGRGAIDGQLICEPQAPGEGGTEDTRLNESQGKALSTLEKFPRGATRGEWWKLSGLKESTFDRARDFLVEGGYVLHDEDTKLYATAKNYAEPPIAA
jgi:hypothetical protein